jgi:hypothetical protein
LLILSRDRTPTSLASPTPVETVRSRLPATSCEYILTPPAHSPCSPSSAGEGFGPDPYLAGESVYYTVKGMQTKGEGVQVSFSFDSIRLLSLDNY